jgi:hypothetical protein
LKLLCSVAVSPFRDAPEVELGPLEVGLEHAAVRAMARLPRGGRVVAGRVWHGASPAVGAFGSAGLVLFACVAAAAWSLGWQPASLGDLALAGAAILLGGASLAAVLSALDRTVGTISRRGDLVGRRAGGVLRRFARLAAVIRRGGVNPGRAAALRRALAAGSDPDLLPWIPADVRGRAALLLARVVAVTSGPAWPALSAGREVRALLTTAASQLDAPGPAQADLAAMNRVPMRIARPTRIEPIGEDHAHAEEEPCLDGAASGPKPPLASRAL